MRVFDHVEVSGIDLFVMGRMLEEQIKVYGDKKYHILIEAYGFRLLQHDKEYITNVLIILNMVR